MISEHLLSILSTNYDNPIIRQMDDCSFIWANFKKFKLNINDFINSFNNNNTDFFTYEQKNKLFFTPSYNLVSSYFSKFKIETISKKPKKICIDYSSPNIAKDLHVGHMRSTNIGQALFNMLTENGNNVHGINHIGDFGTQFGKLIQLLYETYPNFQTEKINIKDLQNFYVMAKNRFDNDNEFKKEAYNKTKLLQTGHKETVEAWKLICQISRDSFQKIYDELNINIEEKGESFYKDMLQDIVDELEEKDLIDKENNDNRKVIKCSNGVFVVQKSDGSFLYGTTDLAALKYRLFKDQFDEIYYIVDKGQEHHFNCLFEIANKLGWITHQKVVHVKFGLVTGFDNKRIRSRDGNTISLQSLLDDAIMETKKVFEDKNNSDELSIKKTAYGAIKYSDLNVDRLKDYKYDPEKMLNLKGNTIIYQFYSHARFVHIINNVKETLKENYKSKLTENSNKYNIDFDIERDLIIKIMDFNNVFKKSIKELSPSIICRYLYDLNTLCSKFYEKCRVLNLNEENSINWSRVNIVLKVIEIQKICFKLLNIEFVSKV